MIKKFFKVLLFLLIIPVFLGVSNIIDIYADSTEGESSSEAIDAPYEEDGNEYGVVRNYLTDSLTPEIIKNFAAPAGYNFVLSISEEKMDRIMEDIDKIDPRYTWVDVAFYYTISGSDIYAGSFPEYPTDRENYRNFIYNTINNFSLFKVDELSVETIISLKMNLEVYTNSGTLYNFNFKSNPIVMEPYDEFDFVGIRANYYQRDTQERRITIFAEPIEKFFYEEPNYNQSGFHTDTMHEIYEGSGQYADYRLEFFAYDTIPLSGTDATLGSIEITYPDEPMPVKARLTFTSGGVDYIYYSKTIIVGDPNAHLVIDGYENRDVISIGTNHNYTLIMSDFCKSAIKTAYINARLMPILLNESEYVHKLFDNPQLPEKGIEGHLYYIPTDEEIERYKNGQELYPDGHEYGNYHVWNKESNEFDYYQGFEIMDGEAEELLSGDSLTINRIIPFAGDWGVTIEIHAFAENSNFSIIVYPQEIKAIVPPKTDDYIKLNVSDNLNVLQNAGDIEVEPTVVTESDINTDYYFKWSLSKEGIVNITELEDGNIVITPIGVGIVDLTVEVESALFSKITKTIKIRSIDSIYDIAKLTVPDEFHYAGKDLEVAVEIRGFTHFQNLDIDWKVLDKNDNIVDPSKYIDNKDGTITILKAERNDYKITASYQGIELDTITVQVRKININKVVRENIWWIFLITIGFVFVILFLKSMLKRGKTTVESIERVYGVYCDCLADDKLTLLELKKINREIKKCMHRCEDLNIEALNQYEKAIRYLRKSANDAKSLLNEWENITPEDKSVYCERLNADLSKALNVAKEIENAKQISEEYHHNANRKNFETIEEDKSKK